ncbi:hypothetical protein BOW51_01265 [Solemya velesiana gill symbiont]|uniref:Uncharacterized protein n=2 Tax=Solemya velesiana gill symbiont TaxID=1918948 RepID=A0A1T2KXV8_9GAMM|nr:hypothetical protein [Solemya velesiana gill symbiont]OOZ37641.1 hypothetical protein BOW51_01265 [Solemya velesiana gill symbiont]
MSGKVFFSIVESPFHPDFSGLYARQGIREVRVTSIRKAISELRKAKPDYVVAEFFYGYGNNYAGVNVSNLDVFLASLQKYAPEARILVMVDKFEREYVGKLAALFPVHKVLVHPVSEAQLEEAL